MEKGLVSVIIPTYNRSSALIRALDSVKAQTYRPIEIIVIDDCSTDNTAKILMEYNFGSGIDLIYILNRTNLGASMSRNEGIVKARGEFIAFLDSDDEWLAESKVNLQVQFLRDNPIYGFVATRWEVANVRVDNLGYGYIFETDYEFREVALFYYAAHTSSWLVRKSIIDAIGGFVFKRAGDYEYLLRIGVSTKCYCLTFVGERYNNLSSGVHQKNIIRNWFWTIIFCIKYRNSYPHFYKALAHRFFRSMKKGIQLFICSP